MERELGAMENVFRLFNKIEPGPTKLCYIYFLSSNTPIDIGTLKDAMKILVERHPLLRMRVQYINGKYIWRELPFGTEMDICVNTSNHWTTLFSESLKESFDLENGPLWGLTLMPNAESELFDRNMRWHAALVLRFSHTIIDGQG